jgi:hypothetical protein
MTRRQALVLMGAGAVSAAAGVTGLGSGVGFADSRCPRWFIRSHGRDGRRARRARSDQLADQLFGGLAGAIVVVREDEVLLPVERERVLVVTDVTLDGDRVAPRGCRSG